MLSCSKQLIKYSHKNWSNIFYKFSFIKKWQIRDQNLPEEEKDENNKIHGLDLKILRNMKCFTSSESFLP